MNQDKLRAALSALVAERTRELRHELEERKIAENALSQREHYLRALLDTFPFWFNIVTP